MTKSKFKYKGVKTGRLTGGKNLQSIPKETFDGCYTIAPEWATSKTKEQAWRKGNERGYLQGRREEKEKWDQERADFQQRERSIRLDALKSISSAGSNIIESMTRALLSYDKNL